MFYGAGGTWLFSNTENTVKPVSLAARPDSGLTTSTMLLPKYLITFALAALS